MTEKNEYQRALELEFEEETSSRLKKVRDFMAVDDLDEELKALRKRNKIYFGALTLLMAVAVGFGYNSLNVNAQTSNNNDGSNYVQQLGYDYNAGYAASSGGGGCGSGGSSSGASGGCCGGGSAGNSAIDKTALAEKAKALYQEKTGSKSKNIDAKVTDFGCHVQVDIVTDGKVVKSYAYRNGTLAEI